MLKSDQMSTTKKLHVLEREFKMCNLRIFNLAETDEENTSAVVLKLKTSLRNVWSSRGKVFLQ
ncbi:unnamed protein product [Callosobruchus maculatus]|uniref:Uncharacterized protein n=1 Tax=Callosobruchus maculatus TaxID=64391 RepID=A0A653CI34_CALMS|nr:unnamed protein product [Callosobruchus maculatus]